MGTGPVDVRLDLLHTSDSSTAEFERVVDQLAADPDVAALAPMTTTRNETVDRDGTAMSLYVENGDHTVLPLTYAEGRAPVRDTEIALSLLALADSGRRLGDDLPVAVDGDVHDLRIVGTYQDITNGGKTAKSMLPTDEEEVMWHMAGVRLESGVDPSTKVQEYAVELAPAKVADIEQWSGQTLGPIADQVVLTAVVSTVVAIALVLLMTALFTRLLVARDLSQIAIQRALGADDAGLRTQYVLRNILVLVVGVVLGAVAAATLGQAAFNLLFEVLFGGFEQLGQGTSKIVFAVKPLLTYAAIPALLLATAAVAAAAVSARSISSATIATLNTE